MKKTICFISSFGSPHKKLGNCFLSLLFFLFFGASYSHAAISVTLESLDISTLHPKTGVRTDYFRSNIGKNLDDPTFSNILTIPKWTGNIALTNSIRYRIAFTKSDLNRVGTTNIYQKSIKIQILYNGNAITTTSLSNIVLQASADENGNLMSDKQMETFNFGSLPLPNVENGSVNFGIKVFDNNGSSTAFYTNATVATVNILKPSYFIRNDITSTASLHNNTSAFNVTFSGTVPENIDNAAVTGYYWFCGTNGATPVIVSTTSNSVNYVLNAHPCSTYVVKRMVVAGSNQHTEYSNEITVRYNTSASIRDNIISLTTNFGTGKKDVLDSQFPISQLTIYGQSALGPQDCNTGAKPLFYKWQSSQDGNTWTDISSATSKDLLFNGYVTRDLKVRRLAYVTNGISLASNVVTLRLKTCDRPSDVNNAVCGDQSYYNLTNGQVITPMIVIGSRVYPGIATREYSYDWEKSTDLSNWTTVKTGGMSNVNQPNSQPYADDFYDYVPDNVTFNTAQGASQKVYFRRKYYHYYDPWNCGIFNIASCGKKKILFSTSNIITVSLNSGAAPIDPQLKHCTSQNFWLGDVNGDKNKDIITYTPRTQNWWFAKTAAGKRLEWINASNTTGFGTLGSNHMLLSGDFDGDGNKDVCFYNRGDQNWYMGLSKSTSLQWAYMFNTAGFGNNMMDGQRTFWTGDVNGDKKDDIIMYVHFNGDWLASISGAENNPGTWRKICNTTDGSFGVQFGNIGGTAYKIFPGDYNGDGKLDFAFYYSNNQAWHVGLSNGTALTWYSAGASTWAGNLMGGNHTLYQGDFDGDNKTDMAFYHKLDGNWFIGKFTGTTLNWGFGGNVSSIGNLMSGSYGTWLGDYNGDKKTDVLIYNNNNMNWHVGYSNGSMMTWAQCGNTSGFGPFLLNANFKHFIGDFTNDGKDDYMFFNHNDGSWISASLNGNTMNWVGLSSVGGCDASQSLRTAEDQEALAAVEQPVEEAGHATVYAYPNPIYSGTLHFSSLVGSYRLLNNSGEEVSTGSNAKSVSVEGLAKGLYLLILDGKTQKIMVQ